MDYAPQTYINTAEAALLLGLSTSTLAKWRLSGEGPVYSKLGRRVVYSRPDIEEWLANNRHVSTSEYALTFSGDH